MTSHSDHLTWKDNWAYLLRCFPSIEKAPAGAIEQFHARGANLRQDWLREAITMAVNKVAKRSLTLEQLLQFYKLVQPPEQEDAAQPKGDAKVFAYWLFPRRLSDGARRHWTESAARADRRPGDRLVVQFTRAGERSWMQEMDESESPEISFEEQRELMANIYGLIAQTTTGRPSTFDRVRDRLRSIPPLEPPLEGSTRASEQASSDSEASATSRTPRPGGLSTPPIGINQIDDLRLARHPLPQALIEQFEMARAALAGQDSTAPEGSARLPAEWGEE
jgi:hypothetical protein